MPLGAGLDASNLYVPLIRKGEGVRFGIMAAVSQSFHCPQASEH